MLILEFLMLPDKLFEKGRQPGIPAIESSQPSRTLVTRQRKHFVQVWTDFLPSIAV